MSKEKYTVVLSPAEDIEYLISKEINPVLEEKRIRTYAQECLELSKTINSMQLQINKLMNALSSQEQVEWRDISSAPKQGIILITNGGGTWPARWSTGSDGSGYYEIGCPGGTIKGDMFWQLLPHAYRRNEP